jgi:hypothetical protein
MTEWIQNIVQELNCTFLLGYEFTLPTYDINNTKLTEIQDRETEKQTLSVTQKFFFRYSDSS